MKIVKMERGLADIKDTRFFSYPSRFMEKWAQIGTVCVGIYPGAFLPFKNPGAFYV